MTTTATVRSCRSVARELGVYRHTIADLVRLHRIPTVADPSNSRTRGLTPAAVHRIRQILNLAAVAA